MIGLTLLRSVSLLVNLVALGQIIQSSVLGDVRPHVIPFVMVIRVAVRVEEELRQGVKIMKVIMVRVVAKAHPTGSSSVTMGYSVVWDRVEMILMRNVVPQGFLVNLVRQPAVRLIVKLHALIQMCLQVSVELLQKPLFAMVNNFHVEI